MLNHLCIISDNWAQLLAEGNAYDACTLLFLLNRKSGTAADLFQFLYTSGQHLKPSNKISICIDLATVESENDPVASGMEALICNLVFHPSFYVHFNVPYIFFINSSIQQTDEQLSAIKNAVIAQAYADVKFIEIAYSTTGTQATPIFGGNDIASFYENNYLSKGLFNRFVIFEKKEGSVTAISRQLLQAEDAFKKEHALLFDQLRQAATLTGENEYLKWKQKSYLDELKNYKTYLKVLKEQDEAQYINNFYYNEYEVLPLWYKQMGHVIKVLTGKRTFKSLFDKNVKKYKN